MGLFTTVIKTGIVVGLVVVGQRLWDRTKISDLYIRLDDLQTSIRQDRHRVGTVQVNMSVHSRDLVKQYESCLTYADSVNELRNNVEVYIASIPD